MSITNTSFEHILHNLHARDLMINDIHNLIKLLFANIVNDFPYLENTITTIELRLQSLHAEYSLGLEKFNIGIITFISDYYSIIDKHSDQFSRKYVHVYSGHRSHYNPILVKKSKSQFFDVEELVTIFVDHCYDLNKFKFHSQSSHLRRSREHTWAIYQKLSKYIASENIYDLSDLVVNEITVIIVNVSKLMNVAGSTTTNIKLNKDGIEIFNKLNASLQKLNNIKLDFKPIEEILDYCECGNVMQVIAGSSEMVCSHCGYIYELKGTVFDDNQFYSQEGTRYKHAGYEPSKHCKCWLERIQARETNTITNTQLSKIEACIKRNGITNKKKLTIEQLRQFLKDSGLTELNEHVALIKKLITGITPPQLTYSETHDITNSFSKSVKAYNIIRPKTKSNLLFYPFLLWKLIEMHVSNYVKKKSLLSFIHLQGTQTLVQNDQIWAQICKVSPGFIYIPTDRYKYSE